MEIRGNLDIHELIQIRGGNPNNEYILTSSDAEGNSLWRQHWFLTKSQWDEWENSYNESEATQNKVINTLSAKFAKLEKEVDSLDDNYVTSGVVNVETQELIFTDKNGGNFTVTNSAALFTDTDTYVMSGEYDPEKGVVTFLTNMHTTFNVTGFAKDLTDTFTDSASLDGNTLTFIRNNKETYDVDLSSLTNEGKHLISGSISVPNRCVTQLNLLMSDDTTVPVDISNVIRDSYVHQMELDNDTNILTLRHADGMGCTVKSNVTVDLSSLKSDDNTNSSIWTETIELPDDPRLGLPVYSAFYNKGHIGIGTNSPQNKLHIEGSGFDNSAIRFLNTASSSFNSNTDYWVMGSRSFSGGADGFEIGRNSETVGGKLYITNTGNVSIGNGHEPTEKLEVNGNTLITNSNSTSDILMVESSFSNLTYGGASGEGTSTNNLTLKHKNKTVNGNTTSSIVLKSAGDEPSISLTSHYTDNGTKISYNEIVMNAGDSKVNIIAADNNAEDAILSIQADESISFQSSIDNAASWPNDGKKTMTIDLTNDKVVIDGGFKLNNGTQSEGKLLISDDEGNANWGYYGLKPKYKLFKTLNPSYKISEVNTFNKFWYTSIPSNTAVVELPDVTYISNKSEVVVKHIGGTQKITINPPYGTKIDNSYGDGIVQISDGDSITFYSDGSNWYIKSHYVNVFGALPSQPMEEITSPPNISMTAYVRTEGGYDIDGDGSFEQNGSTWTPLSPDGNMEKVNTLGGPREVQIITSDGSSVDLFETVSCAKATTSANDSDRYASGEIFTVNTINSSQICTPSGYGILKFRHVMRPLLIREITVHNNR